MMGGTDITADLTAGQIGADINLRDNTLPTMQAGLDEFSQNMATQFAAQGLTLFTNAAGAVPQTGSPVQTNYVGFAGAITVNPAVVAQPTLVRDGTNSVAGSVTGASTYTPNPAGGPSGFTTLIGRILTYALGNSAQAGVVQPASNTSGLGAAGTLSLPYTSQATLDGTATAFAGAEASDSAQASANSTAATSLQTALQSTLSQSASVNVDQQMSNMVSLQNAYAANAKVITTIQAMWQVLEQMT